MAERVLTLGTDCEYGLYHRKTGNVIPASKYNTPPEKGEPAKVELNGKQVGTYHRDNILLEFQTPVCATFKELAKSVLSNLTAISGHYTKEFGCQLIVHPSYRYTQEMVEIGEAQEMGCDPDLDAYNDCKEAPPPQPENMGRYRGASGHIHIGGIADMDLKTKGLVVRWLDALVAPWLAHQEFYSNSAAWIRRRFYGQAGRFRNKPYGLEWRTPSNSWTSGLMRGNSINKAVDAATPNGVMGALSHYIPLAVKLAEAGVTPESHGDVERLRDLIDASTFFEKQKDRFLDKDGVLLDDQYADDRMYYDHIDNLETLRSDWSKVAGKLK